MAFLQQGGMAPLEQPSTAPTAPAASEPRAFFSSQRAQRQLGLFFAGAGFFALSTLVTRRSLVRRYKASVPKFYQPSNGPLPEVNGAMEAFEALNLATINVMSGGMVAMGGLLYAFDIASVDDMRRDVRSRFGMEESRTDVEGEKEIEELFASIMNRKLFKEASEKVAKENEEKKKP